MSLPPKVVPKTAAVAVSGPGSGPSSSSQLRATLTSVSLPPGAPAAPQPGVVPPPQYPFTRRNALQVQTPELEGNGLQDHPKACAVWKIESFPHSLELLSTTLPSPTPSGCAVLAVRIVFSCLKQSRLLPWQQQPLASSQGGSPLLQYPLRSLVCPARCSNKQHLQWFQPKAAAVSCSRLQLQARESSEDNGLLQQR
ncbi:hypothetical protein FQA47_024564 [Oryzias melastigma]|uniref:Uncharacterized protein n=1 Tax=Oryzias melastigma TaxID=30732 RepID=A0A834FM55_ORYME|nr:hypothetical protein FQA47_024564 [Oryzias melastigma]